MGKDFKDMTDFEKLKQSIELELKQIKGRRRNAINPMEANKMKRLHFANKIRQKVKLVTLKHLTKKVSFQGD